jgi:hypothetical protein
MPETFSFGDLAALTLVIAFGFFLAVAFYESLSTRDVLLARVMRLTKRFTSDPGVAAAAYAVTVFVLIPILVVVWATVLEILLFFVGSVDIVDSVGVIAVSVVGAARVLAYVREKTSHELAKAIPLALGFVLLTGEPLELEEKVARLQDGELASPADEMLLFLIVLELGLRIVTDGSHALLAWSRRRRGIDSNAGVWRTIWAEIRQTFRRSTSEPSDADEFPQSDEVSRNA